MRETSRTVEEILGHKISAVIAEVLGIILFPVSVAADFERDRSFASLYLTLQKEFFCEPRALTVLPFLDAEIAEFILATTSTRVLAC